MPPVDKTVPVPLETTKATPLADNSNQIVEDKLREQLSGLESSCQADCLTYIGPILTGVDEQIRDAIEDIDPKQERLCVILETSGGYIEVAQRIADTLRHHYTHVEFIVASHAMSAGTVLVMCGDAIHMDYYSVLGPIDPQVQTPGGWLVPALGYLQIYERLIEKSRKGTLTTAELAYLVQNFNPAELYQYEQARNLSIALLKEWLVKYKFKNWKKTETRGLRVTQAMRTRRAAEIAKMLNDTERWNSHGRGISRDVLIRDVRLQIEDFGAEEQRNQRVRKYHKLLKDYMARLGTTIVIHYKSRFLRLGGA